MLQRPCLHTASLSTCCTPSLSTTMCSQDTAPPPPPPFATLPHAQRSLMSPGYNSKLPNPSNSRYHSSTSSFRNTVVHTALSYVSQLHNKLSDPSNHVSPGYHHKLTTLVKTLINSLLITLILFIVKVRINAQTQWLTRQDYRWITSGL